MSPVPPLSPPLEFAVAYARYRSPIQAKCRRILGHSHSAEDVVQETFVRLWKSGLADAEETDARTVMAWLYRTCTRLSIDVLRERRKVDPREMSETSETNLPCGVDLAAAAEAAMTAHLDSVLPVFEQVRAAHPDFFEHEYAAAE